MEKKSLFVKFHMGTFYFNCKHYNFKKKKLSLRILYPPTQKKKPSEEFLDKQDQSFSMFVLITTRYKIKANFRLISLGNRTGYILYKCGDYVHAVHIHITQSSLQNFHITYFEKYFCF